MTPIDSGVLYLEDLQVGQRFTSATRAIEAEEIKAFARQIDPQPSQRPRDPELQSLRRHQLYVELCLRAFRSGGLVDGGFLSIMALDRFAPMRRD